LEEEGIIQQFTAVTDPARLGMTCISFVEVTLGRHGQKGVERFIRGVTQIPEVVACYHITGDADFLLKVMSADIPAYEDFLLRHLTALPDVEHLKTQVVLSTLKREVGVPVSLIKKEEDNG
jgi:Lrp/AsnC family leucine-responsive transcriptional regulator